MEPLFDKPMDELREAFVRARFAEAQVFDRPDIEEWLERLRGPQDVTRVAAWDAPFWNQFMALRWNGPDNRADRQASSLARILRDYATPTSEVPIQIFGDQRDETIRVLRGMLDSTTTIHHLVGPRRLILVNSESGRTLLEGLKKDTVVISPTTADDVVWALFQECFEGQTKAEDAFRWLKGQYSHAIGRARSLAETDFDEAVAVSADGKKIVKADEVCVVLGKDRVVIYPASAFSRNKILRSTYMARLQTSLNKVVDNYARWILLSETMRLARASGQFLDCSFHLKGKTRLVTELRFCPSPLPEGGVETHI